MTAVRFIFVTIAISLLLSKGYGQRNNYIETDSTYLIGIRLIKEKPKINAQFIRVKKKNEVVEYKPNDLKGYGFKDGSIFESFEININNQKKSYFLEKIYSGSLNLYFLPIDSEKKYFIAQAGGTSLTELPRRDIGESLLPIVGSCENSTSNTKWVSYTRGSLIRYFRNFDDCSKGSFPRFRFSLAVGSSFNRLSIKKSDNLLNTANHKYTSGLRVGFQAISPIGPSDFSFDTGLILDSYRSSTVFNTRDKTYDLVINQLRISIPIMLRYTFHSLRSSPFISIGSKYSRNISGKNILFSYQYSQDNIIIDTEEANFIAENQLGFSFQSGLIIKYDNHYSVLLHAAFDRTFSVLESEGRINVNQFMVGLGLMF